jgi:hypothetical protein
MNTQNVNVRTAAQESTGRWGKSPESIYMTHKASALAELAKIEGDLMMYRALKVLGTENDYTEEAWIATESAAENVAHLSGIGAINSQAVYEMVCSVEALAREINYRAWRGTFPGKLYPLSIFQAAAKKEKAEYIAVIAKGLEQSFIRSI